MPVGIVKRQEGNNRATDKQQQRLWWGYARSTGVYDIKPTTFISPMNLRGFPPDYPKM